jgi:hypothetical protein
MDATDQSQYAHAQKDLMKVSGNALVAHTAMLEFTVTFQLTALITTETVLEHNVFHHKFVTNSAFQEMKTTAGPVSHAQEVKSETQQLVNAALSHIADVPNNPSMTDGIAHHAHQDMYQLLIDSNVSQLHALNQTQLLVTLTLAINVPFAHTSIWLTQHRLNVLDNQTSAAAHRSMIQMIHTLALNVQTTKLLPTVTPNVLMLPVSVQIKFLVDQMNVTSVENVQMD